MIAPLGPADAEASAALHAACFERAWPAADFARYASEAGFIAIGLFGPPALIGLIVAQTTSDEVEVLTVAVDPAARGCGHGAALMRALIDAAPQARLILDVAADNIAALALYKKIGLVEIGRRKSYYAQGADALVMALAGKASREA
jgi:ribosomal-protein-alanine N-acetyltransferase